MRAVWCGTLKKNVCTFKTSPFVPAPRPHVVTLAGVGAGTHGGVLNVHTGGVSNVHTGRGVERRGEGGEGGRDGASDRQKKRDRSMWQNKWQLKERRQPSSDKLPRKAANQTRTLNEHTRVSKPWSEP